MPLADPEARRWRDMHELLRASDALRVARAAWNEAGQPAQGPAASRFERARRDHDAARERVLAHRGADDKAWSAH